MEFIVEKNVITVTITTETTYTFPDAESTCPAHGQTLCIKCARNPGNCGDSEGTADCGHYLSTGMHWDTCPNRIR